MEVQKPFTPQTLADHWGCSPNTVYRMINAGQIRPFRLGGKLIRISVEEVLRWERLQADEDTDPTMSENTGSSGTSTSSSPAGMRTAQQAQGK